MAKNTSAKGADLGRIEAVPILFAAMTQSSASPQQILLNIFTLLAAIAAGFILLTSWFQPPPQTQLDLLQTNLSLQAARSLDDPEYQSLAQGLLGTDIFETAAKRYQQATTDLQKQLSRVQSILDTQLEQADPSTVASRELESLDEVSSETIKTYDTLRHELDGLNLRTGLLLAYQDAVDEAAVYWDGVETTNLRAATDVIEGLWGMPRRILPEAETRLRSELDGWFEAVTLQRLFTLQQRTDALNALTQEQERLAVSALIRLSIVGGIPVIGIGLGVTLLVSWIVWTVRSKRGWVGSVWTIPWTGFEVQAVLTGWFAGFLFLGWLVPRIYVAALRIPSDQLSYWQQAVELFVTYTSGAALGILLIIGAVKDCRPLPSDLFRVKWLDPWPAWGLAGYFAAMPLVLVAAAVSQWLLSQGGGGNPLLPLILDSQGWGPRIVFFVVVSVCAPVFEEVLFRGFFLTSLTKYLPTWGAIGLSGILFAVAHLNFSDLLPLTALGIVLGIVYSHSRNLLAPMLLHSFWNAGSLLALLILGSA